MIRKVCSLILNVLTSGPDSGRFGRLRLPRHVRDGAVDRLHVRARFRRRTHAGSSPQIEIHSEIRRPEIKTFTRSRYEWA